MKFNDVEIHWDNDFDRNGYTARLAIPHSWMMESSLFKRKIILWWWLTKLVWKGSWLR